MYDVKQGQLQLLLFVVCHKK